MEWTIRITKHEISNRELWYWLCNLTGIGQTKLTYLLDYFSDPMDIYYCEESELLKVSGLKPQDCCTILEGKSIDKIRVQLDKLDREKIQFYSYVDKEYPDKLRNIDDSPYGIYVLGSLPDPRKPTIAVIGTRNCSPYGREVARYFSSKLAQAGVQIISGMARGVDTYGHIGALEAGGYTMAVLGSGIDYCYPKENIELYMKLEEQGGIVSEYGPGTLPKAGHFPLRNRIISGLSDGILVVEAKEKSGSLITADQGLEQGKDIFAIPGRINDVLSAGTNRLIKYGAQMVTTPEEILDYYHLSSSVNNPHSMPAELSSLEGSILACLKLEPMHINEVSQRIESDLGSTMQGLLQLKAKHLVSEIAKNYYIKNLQD